MGMYNTEVIKEFGLSCGPGRTKQSFKDEVDVNKILKNFEKTGMIEHLATGTPFYGDVSDIKDYQEAINVVEKADELFMSMSPEIRERFQNDPAQMIKFLEDSKNQDEAIKLGMVVQPPEKPKAEVVEKPK